MENGKKVEKYVRQSHNYLRNASNFIDAANPEKAGEFLWGSMAQALKALAASRGIHLRTHSRIWDYVDGLAKELEDKSIYDAFVKANHLHTNFYESELELKDVRIMAEDIRLTVGKLLSFIPEEDKDSTR